MMDIPLNTIMDLAIILLLVPTIVYAAILNRRLSALRNSRDELAKVVSSFNEATMRAEAGIPKLKKATLDANNALQERVEKAHALRDDLAFMVERAEETADRLEGAVRTTRAVDVPQAAAAPSPIRPLSPRPAPPRAVASQGDPSVNARTLAGAAIAARNDARDDDSELDLRAAIGAARAEAKVSGKREPGPVFGAPRPVAEAMPAEDERSEAERELLKALQSAR
jgi:FtsZ-interacting cell division protein ZipA